MTDFGTVMQLTPIGDRRWSAELPADWGQGRTTFGGVLAGLAARVAHQVVGADRPLRSLDVAFVAPVRPGVAELELEILGEGTAVTQLVVSIRSGGVLGCRVHIVAGAARVSAMRVDTAPAELPEGDPAEQGVPFPYLPGITPDFVQHIEYRYCGQHFPFEGGGPETARLKGWARHRSVAQGLEATIALLDSWPPVVIPMATGPTPFSTIRWAIHLAGLNELSDQELAEVDAGAQWFWYEAQTVQCADGYATGTAAMYAADGTLLAWSEQLIAVYDRPAEAAATPAAATEGAEIAEPAASA